MPRLQESWSRIAKLNIDCEASSKLTSDRDKVRTGCARRCEQTGTPSCMSTGGPGDHRMFGIWKITDREPAEERNGDGTVRGENSVCQKKYYSAATGSDAECGGCGGQRAGESSLLKQRPALYAKINDAGGLAHAEPQAIDEERRDNYDLDLASLPGAAAGVRNAGTRTL